MKLRPKYYFLLLLWSFLLLFINFSSVYSQCDTCDFTTTFIVDLSASPDSVWISPDTQRDGVCCNNPGLRCLRFIVTTNPGTDQIAFNIATPPIPPGQFYQYECGPYVSAGEPLCVTGTGPHCIVYCKPGADLSQYSITVSNTIDASPDIAVSDGCTGIIWAVGFQESSIVWNSIFPGSYGQYNYFLDCPVGCDTTGVTPQAGYPPYVDYEVSGNMNSPCSAFATKDTVRVYFIDTSSVSIYPEAPVVCFGATNAQITAYPDGGAPPYTYLWSTGETTQSISVGIGTYWVQVNDTTDCPPKFDTVVVTQHAAPITANAGPDQLNCISNPNAQLAGNVTVATGGIWSGGTGTFVPDPTALNAVYIPTPAEVTAGWVTLTLTTTGNGGCPPAADLITISFLPEPVVDAGSDQTVCANNASVSLSGSITVGASQGAWTSSGTGTFLPNSTSLTPIYIPSNSDTAAGFVTLTLTSTNGCLDISDNLIITIYPAPYVYAGTDQFICENDLDVTLNGVVSGGASTGIWSSLGGGTFSPNNTSLNSTYNISSSDLISGNVVLILTSTNNGSCNPVADTMVISILDIPVANAGPDQIICSFSTAQLEGLITGGSGTGIWTTPNGTGTFNPGHTDLNALYNPSALDNFNGAITLILTSTNNGTCLPSSDNMVIVIEPAPIVFAGPNQIVCANNSATQLSGSVTNGATEGVWTTNGTGIFTPDDTDLNATYLPSDADTANGLITLTLTSTNGCDSVSDNMNVIITPSPLVDAGPDDFICHGDSIISLSGSVSAGATTGQWTTLGTGYFSPGANQLITTYIMSPADTTAGGVTLILESTNNGDCLPVTDTLQVFITSIASVFAGSDQTICGNMTADLSGNVMNGSGTGQWSATGGTGYFSPSDTSLNASYFPGSVDTANGSVWIVLSATDVCMPGNDSLLVTILPSPQANAGPDQLVCSDDPNVSLNGWVISWASPGLWMTSGTGTFSPGANSLNATYIPSTADISAGYVSLILATTNNGICNPDYDTMIVTIIPPPIANAGSDLTVCANNVAALNGQISGGSGQGVWSALNGSGYFSPSDSVLNATYYPSAADTTQGFVNLSLSSVNNGSCNPVTDQIIINFTPAPYVFAGNDQLVCENNSDVNLSGSVNIALGGIWSSTGYGSFFPGNTTLNVTYIPGISDLNNGYVSVILTSTGNGLCLPESDTMDVTITHSPYVNAGNDKFICEGTMAVSVSGIVSGITNTGQWSSMGSGTFFPGSGYLNVIYNLSSADVVAGAVGLVLTSTNNQYCNAVMDTVWIYITEIPTSNAGVDQIVCANNSEAILNGVVTGSTGTGVWSAINGTGIFLPNSTDMNASYYPGDSDTAQGSVTIILTATNACIPVTDTMILTISPAPHVGSGVDLIVCESAISIPVNGAIFGGATTGIWSTTGSGMFSPSDTQLATNYIPGINDTAGAIVYLILESTNNGDCLSETDTMMIEFGVSPVADFIFPDTICINEIVSFTNTSTISSGSIVSHEWNFGGANVFNTLDAFMSFNSPGIYDVELTESSDIGCTDIITQSVTVNPLPFVNFGLSSDCTGDSISFIDNSINAVQWQWIFGNGNTSTDQNPDPQVYTLPGDYNASLTIIDHNGCSNTYFDELLIFATPLVDAIYQDVCLGDISNFNDASFAINDTVTSWFWDFGNGSNSFSQNAFCYYADSGIYSVALTVSTDHCTASDTFNVHIQPVPEINIMPSATDGCNLSTIIFTNLTTNAINYHWNFGDGVTSILPSPSHMYINAGLNDIVFNVELIAYSSNGCSDTLNIPITIHPSPVAAFIVDALPGCSPLMVAFNNLSNGASTYYWNFGDGNNSVSTNPVNTYYNDTTFIMYYQVQLNVSSAYGCMDSAINYITVFPNTDFNFNINPDSSCHPDIVHLSAMPGAFSYVWIYGDGDVESSGPNSWHVYTNTGMADSVYTVQLVTTSYYSCVDTVQELLVVHPTPNAEFVVDSLGGCTTLNVQIDNISTGAVNYYWAFGDGDSLITTSQTIIIHPYTNYNAVPVSYNLTLIAENSDGCRDYYTQSVNVYPGALSDFIASDSIGCSPLEVDFINNSLGADHYYWDFGDGNSSTNTNPHNTFVNSGLVDSVYTIALVAISPYNCMDTSYFQVTVHPKPEALFGLPNSAGCSPFNVELTNSSIGANQYLWQFGDGDSSTSSSSVIYHSYSNLFGLPANYTLSLTAENGYGCVDTVMQTIIVFPEVTAEFVVDTIGCSPYSVYFSNQSLGAVSFFWQFGDGNTSTDISPGHIYNNFSDSIQVYYAQLITYSGHLCTDTAIQEIVVYPKPEAVFSIDSIIACTPFNAQIFNNTTGATLYDWDFGDGTSGTSSAQQISHMFYNYMPNSYTFTINLHVENDYGCVDDEDHYVTLFPNVTPIFVCDTVGCSPLNVEFFNLSVGASSYYWEFGDGATSGEPEPAHTYTNTTVNDVVYIVTLFAESADGCINSLSRNITVYATPFAEFYATPTYQVYPETMVNIDNNTIGPWDYLWDFGDTTTSISVNPVNHIYDTCGIYTILLTLTSQHCQDTLSHTIIIDPPPPVASFSPGAEGCAPLTVSFINHSQYGLSYLWSFGDGGASTEVSPVYTFYQPGPYQVTLTVYGYNGQNDITTGSSIIVHPSPTAFFQYTPSLVSIPDDAVFFFNLSDNADYYYWDFGDGSPEDTAFNPIHNYEEEGTYDVTLIVWNEFGCYDTMYISEAVVAETNCQIIFPNAFTPNDAGPSGGYYTPADKVSNDIFFPTYQGIIEYTLEIYNRWGELIFVSQNLEKGWDGYYRDEPCKQDVYIWKARWKCVNKQEYSGIGDVLLLR